MVKRILKEITKRIMANMDKLNEEEIKEFIDNIVKSKNIFIVGAGRSGLVGRAFAMRLMHLGFNVYVIGETITPSVKKDDLLIAISGSGRTSSTLSVVETAKEMGIRIISVTSHKDSPIAKLSDVVVKIPGTEEIKSSYNYVSSQLTGEHEPLTPLGSMFELSTMLFLDSLIAKLMSILKKREKDLRERHANLQ